MNRFNVVLTKLTGDKENTTPRTMKVLDWGNSMSSAMFYLGAICMSVRGLFTPSVCWHYTELCPPLSQLSEGRRHVSRVNSALSICHQIKMYFFYNPVGKIISKLVCGIKASNYRLYILWPKDCTSIFTTRWQQFESSDGEWCRLWRTRTRYFDLTKSMRFSLTDASLWVLWGRGIRWWEDYQDRKKNRQTCYPVKAVLWLCFKG